MCFVDHQENLVLVFDFDKAGEVRIIAIHAVNAFKHDQHALELVALLDGWEPKREIIHAVFPSRRGLLPSVRALVDFLTEEYARMIED